MGDAEKVDLSGNIDIPVQPDSSKQSLMEKLGGIPVTPGAAKDWVLSRRQNVRPWSEFLNSSRFEKPASVAHVGSRAVKNLEHFMSNYVFVFLILIIFCILTSPMLLIAIGISGGAAYYVRTRSQSQPLKVMGRELSPSQQYAGIGAMSFLLLWLSGAGGAVFWILGASMVLIGLHAIFYKRPEETSGFDLDMEEVITS